MNASGAPTLSRTALLLWFIAHKTVNEKYNEKYELIRGFD
jgi:hypothetical protein